MLSSEILAFCSLILQVNFYPCLLFIILNLPIDETNIIFLSNKYTNKLFTSGQASETWLTQSQRDYRCREAEDSHLKN